MSSPNYVDYLVRQEQYKDLLCEAKQERMVKAFRSRPGHQRVIARRNGAQVMKWSSTRQSDVSTSSARVARTGAAATQARL